MSNDDILRQDPDGCTWCAGLQDGYRVGPDGVDPAGNPAAGYNETLFSDPDYRRGLSIGRSDRIDEQLMAADSQRTVWPAAS